MGTRTFRPRRLGLVPDWLARVVTVVLIFTMWGPLAPTSVFAQSIPPLNCAVNGVCLSGDGVESGLMGLPQGTLRIANYDEWDRVVQGRAAGAWLPLELEARATLAMLHGVANDRRLPHFAYDELRATMFLRLLALIRQKSQGTVPLTEAEQDALDMLGELVAERRAAAGVKAIEEYDRWASNPCGYQPPAGFSFVAYDPGPKCKLGGVNLSGPPSPPSAKAFTAYGKALASVEFTSAAATTAWENVDRDSAFFLILSTAILASTVAAVIGLFAMPAAVGALVPVVAVLSTYTTVAGGFFAAGARR